MRQKSFATAYFEGHKVFWILVSAIVFLIGLYFYFISASIINVLIREEVALESAAAHSRISELEIRYVLEKDRVTKELAEELGYVAVREKHFVKRAPLGRGLTIER